MLKKYPRLKIKSAVYKRDLRPLSREIVQLIDERNIGEYAIDIFIGKQPNDPDNCVTIYDTGGPEQNPKYNIDNSNLQIKVRDIEYYNGYKKIFYIKSILEGIKPTIVYGDKIIGCWVSNITHMKYDENDRAIFIMNIRITREMDMFKSGNRIKI